MKVHPSESMSDLTELENGYLVQPGSSGAQQGLSPSNLNLLESTTSTSNPLHQNNLRHNNVNSISIETDVWVCQCVSVSEDMQGWIWPVDNVNSCRSLFSVIVVSVKSNHLITIVVIIKSAIRSSWRPKPVILSMFEEALMLNKSASTRKRKQNPKIDWLIASHKNEFFKKKFLYCGCGDNTNFTKILTSKPHTLLAFIQHYVRTLYVFMQIRWRQQGWPDPGQVKYWHSIRWMDLNVPPGWPLHNPFLSESDKGWKVSGSFCTKNLVFCSAVGVWHLK